MNPFTLYPTMPGSTAHPERPWWYRMVIRQETIGDRGYVNGELFHWSRWPDGKRIQDCRWIEGPKISGYYIGEVFDMSQLNSDISEMDRLDDLYPLPRPALMPGQVWANLVDPADPLSWSFMQISQRIWIPDNSKSKDYIDDAPNKLLIYGPNNQRWAPPGWTKWALPQENP